MSKHDYAKKMEYGFIDLWGGKWLDIWVDRYNDMTAEIEQKRAAGYDVEWFLNARHRYFVACGQAATGKDVF